MRGSKIQKKKVCVHMCGEGRRDREGDKCGGGGIDVVHQVRNCGYIMDEIQACY